MKEIFLSDIPSGNTTLAHRIFLKLKEDDSYILSKGLLNMIREMSGQYKAKVLGIHVKRTMVRLNTKSNPYSLGGVDSVHKFHY